MKKELTLNQKGLRFGIMEFVFWSINAAFSSYTAAFGLSRGYSQTAVSRIAAIYMLTSFIFNFIWSSASDKLRTNKRVFQIGMGIAFVAHIGMWYSTNIVVYAAFYALLGAIIFPMGSVLETWFLKGVDYNMDVYGKYRALGSVGYAVGTLCTGFLVRNIGYYIMPILANSLVTITFLSTFLLREDRSKFSSGEQKEKIKMKDILSILRIPTYLVLLIILFLIGVSVAPINSLKIVLIREVGGDVSIQGIEGFIGCLVQGLLFIVGAKMTKIKPYTRLLGCAALYFAALVNYCFVKSVPQMIVSSMIVFSVYSIMMMTGREIVREKIKAEYQTTANGLLDTAYGAMASTVALSFSGSLADGLGIRGMIYIMAAICFVPFLMMIVLFLKSRKTA